MPTFTYVKVLVTLTALMLLTIFAAQVNLPEIGPISGTIVNQTVALVIAVAKAFLVVWVFMGVRWGTTLTKLWAVTGFVWFFLLFGILVDYPMRAYEGVEGFEKVHESALPRQLPPANKSEFTDPNAINLRPRG